MRMELDKIYRADSVEFLSSLPPDSVDFVLTSPPYDELRTYEGCVWDCPGTIRELYRVLKPGGVVVWIVSDMTKNGSETGTSFRQALAFMSAGFRLHDTMIYMKDNPPPTGGHTRYYQAFEYMFVFSKGAPKTFHAIIEPRRNKWNDKRTIRYRPVVRNKAGIFTKKEIPINQGQVKLQNVWSYTVSGGSVSEDKYAHEHPAIFPEALARDHIITWTNPGDLIVDPFSGSGTTAKIALRYGRHFICADVCETYCELSRRRVADEQWRQQAEQETDD